MGVLSYIQKKKEQHRQKQAVHQQGMARSKQTEQLHRIAKLERQRAEEGKRSEMVARERQLERDIKGIQNYNAGINPNQPKQPSKMQRFGKGLAAVMNKGKTGFKEAKKAGFFRGINNETQGRKQSSRISAFGGFNRGSSGGNNSPFSLGPQKQQRAKPKGKTIIIRL